jgi:hypothetical protein
VIGELSIKQGDPFYFKRKQFLVLKTSHYHFFFFVADQVRKKKFLFFGHVQKPFFKSHRIVFHIFIEADSRRVERHQPQMQKIPIRFKIDFKLSFVVLVFQQILIDSTCFKQVIKYDAQHGRFVMGLFEDEFHEIKVEQSVAEYCYET